jgi:hypothetical protein
MDQGHDRKPVTANASASLFHGAPAVAFVLHTGAHPAYAAMLAALDEHVNDLTALNSPPTMSASIAASRRGRASTT